VTFLLDTNVISELRKHRPHGAVLRWYHSFPSKAFALPAVALYEIQAGAEIIRAQDPAKADEIERWLEAMMNLTTVVSLNAEAARETARILHGKSKTLLEDAMIAAIARVNGLVVATRNIRDFEKLDVPLANPFAFTA